MNRDHTADTPRGLGRDDSFVTIAIERRARAKCAAACADGQAQYG